MCLPPVSSSLPHAAPALLRLPGGHLRPRGGEGGREIHADPGLVALQRAGGRAPQLVEEAKRSCQMSCPKTAKRLAAGRTERIQVDIVNIDNIYIIQYISIYASQFSEFEVFYLASSLI